jgi:hypothetical protein
MSAGNEQFALFCQLLPPIKRATAANSALVRGAECTFCSVRIPLSHCAPSVRDWLCSEVTEIYRLMSESAESS